VTTSHEDDPPLVEPHERPSYPGFSGPDEITQTELRSPLRPAKRTTLSPEDADRLMVRKALEASANATEALNKLLPQLATKHDVEQLTAGIKLAIAAAEGAAEAVDQLRADVRLWLFGDEHRTGLSQQVEGTFELAKTTYDGVFNGADSVSDAKRKVCEAIARK